MIIRKANVKDIDAIAEVHLMSWRTTYKGIISDSYLSNLTIDGRRKNWLWTFNNLNQDETIFVAVENDGRIIGFSNSGKNRNTEYVHEGELYAIYLLEDHQGRGIGRKLFQASVNELMQSGYKSMMLWVLENNPSLRFYQSLGGRIIGKKSLSIGEDDLIELAIGWGDIREVL
jgi:ribosomal protein S18 acetylase RimI-like enzyme